MAGDWIKWAKGLTRKREVVVLASKLGRDRREIAGRLMELWEWCDENLSEADFDETGHASLIIGDNCPDFVDETVGLKGFAAAMASPEVAWLVLGDGGRVTFPNFANHNGKPAKTRLLEQKKKARQRAMSPKCPDDNGTKRGTRGEESERREENSNRDRPIGANRPNQPAPAGQSPLDDSLSKAGKPKAGPHPDPIDLEGINWPHVMQMAASLGKRVAPHGVDDRRMWFKFAIIAEVEFSEHWLMDAAEAVVNSVEHRKNRQAHLVAVLKSKAAEEGVSASAFRELLRRIEVPADVWKSDVLKVK